MRLTGCHAAGMRRPDTARCRSHSIGFSSSDYLVWLLRWSFQLTLLCWSKRGLGFEESVELAGHVADQAASDLAVGLALSPAPLGISAGRRVLAQPGQDDQVEGLVELAIPRPVEADPHGLAAGGGDGGSPPSMAKAASVRQRPGWDQAHRTMAATIGPTPRRLSRSGRQARTRAVMARVWSAISASRSWMRRARARRLATVAAVSGSVSAR